MTPDQASGAPALAAAAPEVDRLVANVQTDPKLAAVHTLGWR